MPARMLQATLFVMLAGRLVAAGDQTARPPALCPESYLAGLGEWFPRVPSTITVEADLASFADTSPGGTWRMPHSGGIASDGLAIEGVSFTRNARPELGSSSHTFDVVVDLRASDRILVDLRLVVIDGERRLPLGAFTDIPVRCEGKSVSRTISITDLDFASFFGGGKPPTLRVERTTLVGGC